MQCNELQELQKANSSSSDNNCEPHCNNNYDNNIKVIVADNDYNKNPNIVRNRYRVIMLITAIVLTAKTD